jgi:hypothetical protein
MRRKQRGITFIGWIFLLVPIAIVGYGLIRLVPIYLNYSRVARSLHQVVQEANGDDSVNLAAIRVAIEKRLDVEGVEFPDPKDFTVTKDGQSFVVGVEYEETAPFISNVQLLVRFSKSERVGKAPE